MAKSFGNEDKFALNRLKNQTAAAEGTSLPPRQKGEFRVPFVSNFRLVSTTQFFGATQFVLSWDQPAIPNIDHYSIWVINAINANAAPLGPYTSLVSPATISIPAQDVARVTFYVQTVLTNGFSSDLFTGPSCTGVTTDNDGTISVSSLATGTPGALLTWDTASLPVTVGPGTANFILVGSGAGAVPQFKSIPVLDLVKGQSTMTALGQIPYVASSGTLGTIAAGAAGSFFVGSGAGVAPVFSTGATLDLVIGRSALTAVGQIPYVGAAGTLATIAAGTADAILVGSGAALAPQFKSASTLDLVVGRSNLTASGQSPYVSAAGTISSLTYEKVAQATVNTTNATITTLQTIAIPTTTTLGIEALIVARRTGGGAGTAEDGARYKLSAVYKNVAGTATIIGVITTLADEDQPAWDATFTISSGNILVQVTGAASNNVTWAVTTRTYQVS